MSPLSVHLGQRPTFTTCSTTQIRTAWKSQLTTYFESHHRGYDKAFIRAIATPRLISECPTSLSPSNEEFLLGILHQRRSNGFQNHIVDGHS
ncbi:MAG: hypothetical protein Ct9H300mP19_08930 [Dehalococcoidia bacterium]|nr:MAG: hypothetical protein Ct9H300mP19_08930 [Dehalococcoidia bacterium]